VRKGSVTVLLVLTILASGTAGYLVGASSSHPTTLTTVLPSSPYERVILTASCSPVSYTGAIRATNVGAAPVNLTELVLTEFGGGHVVTYFPHGIVIVSGNETTLTQGYYYMGGNVTIGVISVLGNLFTTSCSH